MPVELELSQGYVAIVDDEDADLADFKWYVSKNNTRRTPYARRNVGKWPDRKIQQLHRVILARMLGHEIPTGMDTDHIDHDGLNNQRSNLRLVTHAENMQNVQKQQNNTSGFKGVWFHKRVKRWEAQIEKDGKRIYLGYFDSPEAAYAAYCKAASELFGEHACFE